MSKYILQHIALKMYCFCTLTVMYCAALFIFYMVDETNSVR